MMMVMVIDGDPLYAMVLVMIMVMAMVMAMMAPTLMHGIRTT